MMIQKRKFGAAAFAAIMAGTDTTIIPDSGDS